MLNYIKSKFKSKHDYARLATIVLVPCIAAYAAFGGNVEELMQDIAIYTLASSSIVTLAMRSPLDDKPQQ